MPDTPNNPVNPESIAPAETVRPVESARLQMTQLVVQEEQPLLVVLRRLCEIAADTLEVERVGIWLLSSDRKALRCANLFERTTREHSDGITLQVADFPDYFQAIESRRALPSEYAQTDPRIHELRDRYLIPLGITSMLDAPVFRDADLIGIVCHEHIGPPREWSTEARDFAMSVADAVSSKIKSAELLITRSALRRHADVPSMGDRMEVVGRLAACIAHDFKNLLTVIIGNANLIERTEGLPPEVMIRAVQIEEAAERGTNLVRELLDFGREPNGTPQVLRLAEVVEKTLPLLQGGAGAQHTVRYTRNGGLGRVLIDRGNLERILLNLVINARDAMPNGGTIGLSLATEQVSEGDGVDGAYMRIDVHDTGMGIPAADIEHIFDPGYTTKGVGKGSGLGLAIVRRIVERAGGFVRVNSTLGIGTTFHLYLPRVAVEAVPK